MRSELINPKEFFKVMKKKPALQGILDNFDSYTMEQLEFIHGQPLWIRKVLVELKQDEIGGIVDEGADLRAEQIADMMMNASEIQQPEAPIQYEVRRWVGNDWFMSCGITGSLKVEVIYDDCLYIIETDPVIEKYLVGMDSSVGILSLLEWNRLMQHSIVVGNMTKPEYSEYVSKQSKKKMTKTPEEREIIAQTAGPRSYVSPEQSQKGFEIIRHKVK